MPRVWGISCGRLRQPGDIELRWCGDCATFHLPGKHDQKEHGGGRLAGVSSTLAGKGNVGSMEEVAAVRAEVSSTPEGAELVGAVDDWQRVSSDPSAKRAEAKAWIGGSEEMTTGAILAEGIGASDPSDEPIYRGVSTQDTPGLMEDRYSEGTSFDTMPASYSTDRSEAANFADAGPDETSVIFEVDPGSRSLNIQPLSGNEGLRQENERVSMGRFTVTEPPIQGTTPEGRPQVTIRIRQDSVFSDK